MPWNCHSKTRYLTRELADEQAVRQGQTANRFNDPARASRRRAYYCPVHGCWHIGNGRDAPYDARLTATTDAIGRLHTQRQRLLDEYGRSHSPAAWAGVRALSGAIKHLQKSL